MARIKDVPDDTDQPDPASGGAPAFHRRADLAGGSPALPGLLLALGRAVVGRLLRAVRRPGPDR